MTKFVNFDSRIMELIRISAVSYLNTFPFVFGIKTSGELEDIDLHLDTPSLCAEKLKNNVVDLALVPVGAIPMFENPVPVGGYCIGAEREVKTVLLLSRKPLHEITDVALDFDSGTSVLLVKVLARRFWKINPSWHPLAPGEAERGPDHESLVAIGDKTLRMVNDFPYVYDLAAEWIRFTSLPFVFAVWLANRKLPEGFVFKFDRALEYGINRKEEIPFFFQDKIPPGFDVMGYLENNISYRFDEGKKRGMELFLKYLEEDR